MALRDTPRAPCAKPHQKPGAQDALRWTIVAVGLSDPAHVSFHVYEWFFVIVTFG